MLHKIRIKHFFYLYLLFALFTLLFDIGFTTHLGNIRVPFAGRYKFYYWSQNWTIFLSAVLVLGLVNSRKIMDVFRRLDGTVPSLRVRVMLFSLLVLLSLAVHYLVLMQMYLTDDESAYRFCAQVLAGGRLTAESFPHKEFFDRIFMINDGRFFPKYYYGWPFLLAAGECTGLPFLINSLFYAGSTFILYSLVKSFTSGLWGFTGALFFLLSPLALVGSATFLSHSSTTFFFLLFMYCWRLVTAGQGKSDTALLPLMAFSGGAMLLIRPFTAVLAAAPFIVALVIRGFRTRFDYRGTIGFAGVGLLLCGLFLWLNFLLHGSVTGSGYSHYVNYSVSNDLVFSYWNPSPVPFKGAVPPAENSLGFKMAVAQFLCSFTRLGFDGVMVPVTLLFVAAVATGFRTGVEYLVSYLLVVAGYSWFDLGIDSFGPVHLSEAAPLGILFVVTFLYRGNTMINGFLQQGNLQTVFGGAAVAFALVACSSLCWLPIRLFNVHEMAAEISHPYVTARKNGIHNAVVFSSTPFIRRGRLRHFRFWRDNPSVNLDDDIIWVNDFTGRKNRELRKLFPDRTFYRMRWEGKTGPLHFDKM